MLCLRRISMLAMCLVVLTTTAGFACLVFAAGAMGMPADHGMPDCGVPSESAAACPHEHPVNAPATPQDTEVPAVGIVAVLPGAPSPMASPIVVAYTVQHTVQPPASHTLPLRV